MNRLKRVIRSQPRAIGIPGTDKTDFGIEIMPVVPASPFEQLGLGLFSHFFRHSRNPPIIHSIFHSDRRGFSHLITRNIFLVQNIRYPILLAIGCRFYTGLKSPLSVETADPLQISISNHRYGTVAGHLIGFPTDQRPDRQFPLLVKNTQHRIHHIPHPVSLDNREPGMQSPVGIPQRKSRIIPPIFGLIDLLIMSPEFSVHITIGSRSDQGMIHRCIEYLPGSLILIHYIYPG